MLALRLDQEEAQRQIDSLLREFVEEVHLWVVGALPMLIQVGKFLTRIIERDLSKDTDSCFLVNVEPFRLALVIDSRLVAFTWESRRISTTCPQWTQWPRCVECRLDQLYPEYTSTLFQQLMQIQHVVFHLPFFHSPFIEQDFRKQDEFFQYKQYKQYKEDKEYKDNKGYYYNLRQKAMYNPIPETPSCLYLLGLESLVLQVVQRWWYGSVKSLAALGTFARAVLDLIHSPQCARYPRPLFFQEGVFDSVIAGIWYRRSNANVNANANVNVDSSIINRKNGQDCVLGLDHCGRLVHGFVHSL